MELRDKKCVIIMDMDLPKGILVNAAAILGISLGKIFPDMVGEDIKDGDNKLHKGIIKFPIPILEANRYLIKEIREKLDTYDEDIVCIDFSNVAKSCKTYEEFIEKMKVKLKIDLYYLGICICGDKKKINRLTGNLPLLR